MTPLRIFFLATITMLTSAMSSHDASLENKEPERWVIYYTDKLPASEFAAYDLVVFDSDHHPPIEGLKAQGKTVLGYISFGEAETYRSYYKKIKEKNLFFGTSDLWKGHHYIDVRNPEWTRMLIEELIPQILAKGFDGIIIDTMDSVVQPEIDDPVKYKGMKQAAIQLIKDVRAAFPHMKMMMNRGLEILPDVAADIDYVMAESTYTDWVPNPKKPVRTSPETYRYYVNLIDKAQQISPKLKVYSMEYWDMKDIEGVKQIYRDQRAQGWVPYVSSMDLQHHTPEPK